MCAVFVFIYSFSSGASQVHSFSGFPQFGHFSIYFILVFVRRYKGACNKDNEKYIVILVIFYQGKNNVNIGSMHHFKRALIEAVLVKILL